ncbi:MAG TPA: phospho-N-acetylmuramoyl-pentapeptide-transferase [Synergistales bacterium]|jgi:phospho-N-acetylmuramoyl-pentapeptide-transferase|nr:phospho-N-acetylmuramoyl-pentapeptide-transferase [Synergistales bacterium]HRV70538.1 phospho-N-acetylmuramoyl-pentapeptide-transferase [Thermovirgaceae bacterium]
MMGSVLFFAGVLVLGVILQEFWVKFLQKRNISQTMKEYGPQNHILSKKGTPTMGGVIFLFLGVVISFVFCLAGFWNTRLAMEIMFFPIAGGLVGLGDDLLKYYRVSSEGLKSLQKLVLQFIVAVLWAVFFLSWRDLSLFPGYEIGGITAFLLIVFFLTGGLNAVNITDGLDGLASGACAISFAAFILLAGAGNPAFAGALSGLAISTGFLFHNSFPARVFMGDCGSHFLGGLLVSVCMAGNFTLLLLPLGFIMGIEVITVIIQIVAIKGWGRKVFLMSPVHHHFELAGWSEKRVVWTFWGAHIGGLLIMSVPVMIIADRFGGA